MSMPGEFDIGPAAELQKKYGWYVENWTPLTLDSAIVPKELHDLIPLAARWGISCDITRHDAGEKASAAELAEVGHLLKHRHDQIYDFLYADHGDEIPDEVSAFQALIVFEMEEVDGPGIPGLLEWRIRKFKMSPNAVTKQALRLACDEMSSFGWIAAVSKSLAEARALLDE
jgi:hypothetical protein